MVSVLYLNGWDGVMSFLSQSQSEKCNIQRPLVFSGSKCSALAWQISSKRVMKGVMRLIMSNITASGSCMVAQLTAAKRKKKVKQESTDLPWVLYSDELQNLFLFCHHWRDSSLHTGSNILRLTSLSDGVTFWIHVFAPSTDSNIAFSPSLVC